MKLFITILLLSFFIEIEVMAQFNKASYVNSDTGKDMRQFEEYEDDIVVISILDVDDSKGVKPLNNLARKYKGKKVTFIIITDGDDVSKGTILNDNGFQYLNKKESHKLFDKYQTGMFKVFPIYVILNVERKVVFKKQRVVKNINLKIEKKLDALLEKMEYNQKFENDENYSMK